MNIYHINWWLPAFLPSTACQKKNGAHGADHRSKVITFQWVKGAAVRMAAVLVMSPPSYTFQRWLSWKFMVPKRPRLCGTAFSTRIQRRHPVTGNMAPWQQPGSKRRWIRMANQGGGVHIGVDKTDTGTILICSWPGQRGETTHLSNFETSEVPASSLCFNLYMFNTMDESWSCLLLCWIFEI